MVSAKSFVLLAGLTAPAVMAAPTEGAVPAPAVVPAAPESDLIHNTGPFLNPNPGAQVTGSTSTIRFTKGRLFAGQSIVTVLDKGAGSCYSLKGGAWDDFNKNTQSFEVLEGGPCTLFTGPACDKLSLGPIHKAQRIPDMGNYYFAKQVQSMKCDL
ncbi:hypothetical protein MAPG_05987 [Magnaporthiopsis poae ATCC 64411]|uniref:Uncharacterized protein n=1 Tax=Magnaporthiopsis poae (strain ATCC 64411 / 73-15) TaxID=644358 RepID=A0A0C4E0V0_MAGP6|nr:hypothetical protein MAPG_05987 [Magnaporthiopsis poae ATCC 64411]